ncbi:vWA domain-containing protein [Pseudoalteromonas ruthenica]|uniref:vWA domain-containing protein n=1 Tax=Pseudoalteromonas ruthenica TaxID=151081 RepID=UPI00241FE993|nr:VWA domain-containing protein [Pseudoalteromonas ruthenica]|tara:strand:+ start:79220 stop:80215 length:996 start_codon:yes stop_codon:yes gene_type:complete
MFEFAWPWAFALLPLPWLIALIAGKQKHHSTLMLRIHALAHMGMTNTKATPSRKWPHWLLAIVWALVVASAANPVFRGEPITLSEPGRDIMLAVDLSGSMREQDMAYQGRFVDRLSVVKAVLSEFISQRRGDQLGLILFADTAFLQTPLTRDVDTVAQMLEESQIGLVGRATAIGDALGLSVKRFNEKSQSNKVVILLTDGQNTAGNLKPEEALILAKDAGVKVYTVGVGADGRNQGGLFSMLGSSGAMLDESLLKTIAEQTGGQYFRATDTQSLANIYKELDALEPQAEQEQTFRPVDALFYLPLSGALLMLFLAALWRQLKQQAVVGDA